ncbi:MAG: ATP-binding cassette domain-containing protein, partial [Comamonas sp.]
AMVFQNYALYPHMSNYENMAYGLKLAKVPADEIKRRVDKAAKILELSHLLDRKPRQLSGGQRQRVAMGRAIVRQPQVFLFDEPLSNLDAKLRGQTRIEIQKLHAELGITSLFVTHDQVEAMTLAQRMIVMNGGNVEQFGTPEEVYHTPSSTFVAGFIGSPPMNLLKNAPGSKAGQIMGIRPEHIDLVDAGGWEFKVDTVELLGAERLVYGKVGGEDVTLRVEEGKAYPKPGETARIQPRMERLHAFHAETGKRI